MKEINKIKKITDEKFDECRCICNSANNGFSVISLVFNTMQNDDNFYQFINQDADVGKKVNKKPTKPGKEKAAECFKKLMETTKDFLHFSDLIAAKIESKKHGVFVMVSYEKCPVDVIEYLISERN